jgi:hypothetical protein
MFSRRRALAGFLILVSLIAAQEASAQNGEAEVKLRDALKGKPITMHRFYRELNQSYDENGVPTFKTSECPWTICAGFLVKDVRLSPDYVELRGTRLYVGFGPKGQSNYDSKDKMTIRIAFAHTADLQREAVRAINTVFFTTGKISLPSCRNCGRDAFVRKPV